VGCVEGLSAAGEFAVEDRIEGGIVVHLELAVELETTLAGEDFDPESGEARGEIAALVEEKIEALAVALMMFGAGVAAAGFFFGVEDLEGEDGEAIDHEAGRFGVQGSGVGLMGSGFEEGQVETLGEVVATLVELVDGALAGGDGLVAGHGVAGGVFAVPEIEVGTVLLEDELFEGRGGLFERQAVIVPVGVGLVVELRDVGGVEHSWRVVDGSWCGA